jgi:hypothetical protein
MAKKHKHRNQDFKINAARHKNEVLAKLRYYFDQWSGGKTFNLLPEKHIDFIYKGRFTSYKIEATPETDISKDELLKFKKLFDLLISKIPAKIFPIDLAPIPMQDFLSYYHTILMYVMTIAPEDFNTAPTIKERFALFTGMHEETQRLNLGMVNMALNIMAAAFSDPSEVYYIIEIKLITGMDKDNANYFSIQINTLKPDVTEFDIDGERRKAFRLGKPFPNGKIDWIKVKPPDTGVMKWQSKLDVYIQAHAIRRMYERLDLLTTESARTDLYFTFLFETEPIFENNILLIPYKVVTQTIGYFKGDISDGKIILRTFLFLTNEGTPEARRLKEIAGLSKIDISYWKIDTLRNFVESDIAGSPVLRKLFTDAGCGALFDLQFDEEDAYSGRIQLAGNIENYLGMGKANADDATNTTVKNVFPRMETD